jgi:hypothetical protein
MFNLGNLKQAFSSLAASTGWECPDCQLGLRAREQFVQNDLGSHALVLLLPFVVVVALSLALERVLR